MFGSTTNQRPRILIVEDEPHIGIGLKFNCEADGYDATLVADGPSALKLFRDDPRAFDLVILDLMLPEMSGYKVLETLRAQHVDVPVLILSARTLSEDRVRSFDLGADQYLMKPFELSELRSRLRNLLTRRPGHATAAREDRYEFAECVVNFTRHEAVVRGKPVALTALEFELLKCFFQSEGIVLTRTQLLDRVWGMDASPSVRTVDNFVMRLRKLFEIDPARPRHFLSVRGVGYRFVREPIEPDESLEE
jgi:two-component system OmpR family response regulator